MSSNGNDKSSPSAPLGLLGMGAKPPSWGMWQWPPVLEGGRERGPTRLVGSTAERTSEEPRVERADCGNGAPGTGSQEPQCGADARRRHGARTLF